MYEHIAYELGYENLSSIEQDSICMKAFLLNLINFIKMFVHIESELHSLKVLTLLRDYKS